MQHRLDRGPEKSVVQKYLPSVLIYFGEVTEWLKVHAWNACVRKYREFESHPLRQLGFKCDSRVLRNRESRTPSGPGGSSGSEPPRVLQGCPAIFFCKGFPAVVRADQLPWADYGSLVGSNPYGASAISYRARKGSVMLPLVN